MMIYISLCPSVSKPEGMRPLGTPICRWEDYIKMNLREIGWEGGDWIYLPQEMDLWWALQNTVNDF
jgi:hypothetical protein